MGGYVGGEKAHVDYLLAFLQLIQVGTMPRVTEWNVASNVYGGNFSPTWVTICEETSGGPWIIAIVRNDPGNSAASVQYRLTVDGAALTTGGTWHQTTNTNHFIGLPFGTNGPDSFGPVFCRESFKVEALNTNATSRSEYAYFGYSIS